MALQVWLTGNNSMENQGLCGALTQVTAPTYVNGKMGKALSTGSYRMTAEQTAQVLNNDEVSIAFWIYINAADGTSAGGQIFGNGATGTNNNRKYSLFLYPTVNDLHWYWQNDTTDIAAGGTLSDVLPSYKWTHVAVTYKNPNGKIYINGVLVKTFTCTMNSATYAYDTTLMPSSSARYLNDYRVYNHCLSVKEIKELSKGLCLHYKLAGIGGENILKGSYDFTGNIAGSGVTTPDGFNGFSYKYLKYEGTSYQDCVQFSSCITPEPNTKYTVSFWAKGNCQIHNFFYPNACAKGVGSNGATGAAADGNTPIGLTSEWTKYWITWTTTASVSGAKSVLIGRIQNKGAGAECYIAGVKFEKGDKATSWTPNPADDLYSALGLDSTIEYDCSGFGNDGTKVGTIEVSPESIRHNTSYNFPSTAYINCGAGAKVTDEITVNAWCYMDTWATSPHICSCTENGGFNFDATEKVTFVIYVSNSYKYATSSKTYASLSSGWHMFTATYDGYNVKLYIDGVLDTTTPTGLAVKTPITYNSANAIFIHAEAGANTSTPATNNYQPCNMSDFRIYATALSAEDIAQLYNTPASIDKAGNLFAYDCIEEGNITSITKQGAVKSYGLLEDESAKIGADSFTANALNEV